MQDPPSGQVGTYREEPLHVAVRREEGSFAVTLYYRRPSVGNVEIAKVDNAHGSTHLHKYFRRDQQKVPVDWSVWEAYSDFYENCLDYAERYDKTHGL